MLLVKINENRDVQVTFDVSGSNEDVICYYIRELKLSCLTSYLEFSDKLREKINTHLLNSTDFDIALDTDNTIILKPKKLIGFLTLAYFLPAIEMQYNELLECLPKKIETSYQFEMILDAIY